MKRLLLPLLAALSLPTAVDANWFGKYGSYREAQEACFEWKNKKGKFKVWPSKYYTRKTIPWEIYIRKCLDEEQTRQFLGLEYPNLKALQSSSWASGAYEYDAYMYKILGSEVIKKRFKY